MIRVKADNVYLRQENVQIREEFDNKISVLEATLLKLERVPR